MKPPLTLTARLEIMQYATDCLNRSLPIFEHPECIALAAVDSDFAALMDKDRALHEAKLAALKFEQRKWADKVEAKIRDIHPTSAADIIAKATREGGRVPAI